MFPYSFALFVSGEATSCRRPRPNCNERVRPAKNGRTGPGLILIIQWIVPDIIFASIQKQTQYKYMYEYLINTGPGPKHIIMWIALNTISAWIQQRGWGYNTALVRHAKNVRPMFSLIASSKQESKGLESQDGEAMPTHCWEVVQKLIHVQEELLWIVSWFACS